MYLRRYCTAVQTDSIPVRDSRTEVKIHNVYYAFFSKVKIETFFFTKRHEPTKVSCCSCFFFGCLWWSPEASLCGPLRRAPPLLRPNLRPASAPGRTEPGRPTRAARCAAAAGEGRPRRAGERARRAWRPRRRPASRCRGVSAPTRGLAPARGAPTRRGGRRREPSRSSTASQSPVLSPPLQVVYYGLPSGSQASRIEDRSLLPQG